MTDPVHFQVMDMDAKAKTIPGGLLIAFEGGEGTGKTTQVHETGNWIYNELGYNVLMTREPGGSVIGKKIRQLLLDHASTGLGPRAEALLYAADRAHHVERVIEPALAAGKIVITDRYADSSIAYQGVARDLGTSEVTALSLWAAAGRVPDLTILLDMDPARARERKSADPDRIEAEPLAFHHMVRGAFRALADRDPGRYLVIDAAAPAAEVQDVIRLWLYGIITERAAHEERKS